MKILLKTRRTLGLVLTTFWLAGASHAVPTTALTYDAFSYHDDFHAVWVPGLDQRHLMLDPGATLHVAPDAWHLQGGLTSATDGSTWSISVDFGGVLSGAGFGALAGFDDGRIKGATWSQQQADWAFAESVTGTLTALTGSDAGRRFSLARYAGTHDYWAQFGTCMNDKNCDRGLSTWLTFTDVQTGEAFRGDINARVEAPVPEPGAALVFAAGALIVGVATKRRTSA